MENGELKIKRGQKRSLSSRGSHRNFPLSIFNLSGVDSPQLAAIA
jgi:hypothetical protein